MLSNRWKNNLKVATTILLVSLLSFAIGAKLANRPLLLSPQVTPAVQKPSTSEIDLGLLTPMIEVMQMIQEKYVGQVELDTLVEGAIKGMVNSLDDPYSLYMNPEDFENFMITIDGSFSGVGISLSVDQEGNVVVISPVEDTPAHRAGILPRDRIIGVDDIVLTDQSLDEVVSYIRGEKGTRVTLTIQREGNPSPLNFELVRDDIRQKTVKHELFPPDIGYIKITSFDSHTHQDFKKSISALKDMGMKALVLDLRNNPGGSLQECVMVADEILGEGLIVYTEDGNNKRIEEFFSDKKQLGLPLVVLVNENSASASEIVAGAIQDHKAGILVGQRTFGKGSVQELEPFPSGGGIKITIAKYYIPSGRSIDGVGIEPDVKVELPEAQGIFDLPLKEDTQLIKALEVLKTTRDGK